MGEPEAPWLRDDHSFSLSFSEVVFTTDNVYQEKSPSGLGIAQVGHLNLFDTSFCPMLIQLPRDVPFLAPNARDAESSRV